MAETAASQLGFTLDGCIGDKEAGVGGAFFLTRDKRSFHRLSVGPGGGRARVLA